MCGVQDPESSNECHRICGLKCLPAAQQPAGKGKGAAHRKRTTPLSSSNAGSKSSAKSGNAGAPSKKSAGGQKRSNLTLNTKMDVLDPRLGKKVKPSAVAEKFAISDRTARQIRKDAETIKRSSLKTGHREEERRASRDHNAWTLVRSVLRAVVQQYCSIFSFVRSTSRTAVYRCLIFALYCCCTL